MASKWAVKFDAAKLREAKAAFKSIANSMDPGGGNVSALWKIAQGEVQDGFRKAAQLVRDKTRSNAASQGAPKRLGSAEALKSANEKMAGATASRTSTSAGATARHAARAAPPLRAAYLCPSPPSSSAVPPTAVSRLAGFSDLPSSAPAPRSTKCSPAPTPAPSPPSTGINKCPHS